MLLLIHGELSLTYHFYFVLEVSKHAFNDFALILGSVSYQILELLSTIPIPSQMDVRGISWDPLFDDRVFAATTTAIYSLDANGCAHIYGLVQPGLENSCPLGRHSSENDVFLHISDITTMAVSPDFFIVLVADRLKDCIIKLWMGNSWQHAPYINTCGDDQSAIPITGLHSAVRFREPKSIFVYKAQNLYIQVGGEEGIKNIVKCNVLECPEYYAITSPNARAEFFINGTLIPYYDRGNCRLRTLNTTSGQSVTDRNEICYTNTQLSMANTLSTNLIAISKNIYSYTDYMNGAGPLCIRSNVTENTCLSTNNVFIQKVHAETISARTSTEVFLLKVREAKVCGRTSRIKGHHRFQVVDDGKSCDTAYITSYKTSSSTGCAIACTRMPICRAFTYNTETSLCVLHECYWNGSTIDATLKCYGLV